MSPEIKLPRRTPEQLKHYAQGFLAALDALEGGMKPDVVRLAGEDMIARSEEEEDA